MTREMNKPDWCGYERICADFWQTKYGFSIQDICKNCPYKKPILDETWKPYIDSINERFKQCGKQ